MKTYCNYMRITNSGTNPNKHFGLENTSPKGIWLEVVVCILAAAYRTVKATKAQLKIFFRLNHCGLPLKLKLPCSSVCIRRQN